MKKPAIKKKILQSLYLIYFIFQTLILVSTFLYIMAP